MSVNSVARQGVFNSSFPFFICGFNQKCEATKFFIDKNFSSPQFLIIEKNESELQPELMVFFHTGFIETVRLLLFIPTDPKIDLTNIDKLVFTDKH